MGNTAEQATSKSEPLSSLPSGVHPLALTTAAVARRPCRLHAAGSPYPSSLGIPCPVRRAPTTQLQGSSDPPLRRRKNSQKKNSQIGQQTAPDPQGRGHEQPACRARPSGAIGRGGAHGARESPHAPTLPVDSARNPVLERLLETFGGFPHRILVHGSSAFTADPPESSAPPGNRAAIAHRNQKPCPRG